MKTTLKLTSFVIRRLQMKNTLKSFFLLACLIVALIYSSQPAYADADPASPVTSACKALSSQGMTYTLSQDIGVEGTLGVTPGMVDITAAGNCFDVTADNVTLDLAGHDVIVDASSGTTNIINVTGDNFTLTNSELGDISKLKQAGASTKPNIRAILVSGASSTLGHATTNNISIYVYGVNDISTYAEIRFNSSANNIIQNLTLSSSTDNSSASAPRNYGDSSPLISIYFSGVTVSDSILNAVGSWAIHIITPSTIKDIEFNNNVINNADGYCIMSTHIDKSITITGTGNTCNGGDLLIYDKPSNTTISGKDVAEIFINEGDNIIVENNVISNGLWIGGTTENSTIRNNEICIKAAGTCAGYALGGVTIYGNNTSDNNVTISDNEIWGAGGQRYWQSAFQIRGSRGLTINDNIVNSAGTMALYFYAPVHPTDIVFNRNDFDLQTCANPKCTNLGAVFIRRGKNMSFNGGTVTSDGPGVVIDDAFSVDPAVPDLKFTDVSITSSSSVDYNMRDTTSSSNTNTMLIIDPPTIPDVRFSFVQYGELPKAQIRQYLNATVEDSLGAPVDDATVTCTTTVGGAGTCDGYSAQITVNGEAPQNSLHIIDRVIEATSCPGGSNPTPCTQVTTNYEHTVSATSTNPLSTAGSGPSTLCLNGPGDCDIAYASPTPVPLSLNLDPTVSLVVTSFSGSSPNYTVNLTATGADVDGTIASYEWDLDGNGTYETAGGSGASDTNTAVFGGTNIANVRVTDNDGATATDTVDFNLVINVPADGDYANSGNYQLFTVSGTAEPNDPIEIFGDPGNVSVGTGTANVSGVWEITDADLTGLAEGAVSLTAVSGIKTSAAVAITYDKTAPDAPTNFQVN